MAELKLKRVFPPDTPERQREQEEGVRVAMERLYVFLPPDYRWKAILSLLETTGLGVDADSAASHLGTVLRHISERRGDRALIASSSPFNDACSCYANWCDHHGREHTEPSEEHSGLVGRHGTLLLAGRAIRQHSSIRP